MKQLRQLHLYLGCLFTPLLILFAVTGAAQMFGLRLGWLSEVHVKGAGSLPLMMLAGLMGLSLCVTSLSGVLMAFRHTGQPRTVWSCLAFGSLVPLALVLIAWFKTKG